MSTFNSLNDALISNIKSMRKLNSKKCAVHENEKENKVGLYFLKSPLYLLAGFFINFDFDINRVNETKCRKISFIICFVFKM